MATDPTIVQTEDDDAPLVAPGKLRSEAVRRLQIGLIGLFTMILLVSLANIIRDRANDTEQTTVPNQVASSEAATPAKDPLADAGVVPELPDSSGAPAAGGNGRHPH
jgi:hypothetical protein